MSFSNPASAAKEAAAAYTGALLALLGDRDPFEVLPRLVTEVRTAVAGLSDADLRRPEASGKWPVIGVVQHLADTELVTGYRIRMILAHDTPEIQAYDQDLWATRLRYQNARLDDALAQLDLLRNANLRLTTGLGPREIDRAGIHSERGPESIRRLLQLIAAHDLVHLRQIARIRAAIKG